MIATTSPPPLSVCFPGTGIEACTKCAEGYLLEDWRCVLTCSSGYYLSEQTSDAGQVQRSCRKWVFLPFNVEPRRSQTGIEVHIWFKGCRVISAVLIHHHRCDHSCYECLGPGERNCSSCVSGYNLEAGACVVSTICKDGELSTFLSPLCVCVCD